jgi:creatinine amidohydrolase
MPTTLLSEMAWPEVKHAIEEKRIVILPVGSTEQHGPQLPLDTDIVNSFEIAKAAAQRTGSLVAPPLYYGITPHWMGFPGTMSIEWNTWIKFVTQIGQSLSKHGFRKLVILNGHGGNSAAIQLAAQNIAESSAGKCTVAAFSYWDVSHEQVNAIRRSESGGMGHSCELETSLQLHLRDHLVKMDRAVKNLRTRQSVFEAIDMMDEGGHVLFYSVGGGGGAYEPGEWGVIGDPTVATKENGRKFFDAIVGQVAKVLDDLSSRM